MLKRFISFRTSRRPITTPRLFASLLFAILQPVNVYGSTALGIANAYNVFLSGNFTATGADTGGRIAVGGSASFPAWYAVGDSLLDSFAAPDILDVGSSITAGPAGVYGGNAFEGTSGSSYAYTYNGTATVGGANPINFAAQFASLTGYATQLSQWAPNSTVSYGSTVTLTGTDPSLEVFDLNVSQLPANYAIDLNVNSSATVLINVNGASFTSSNWGEFLNGTQIIGNGATGYDNILFNFYNATSITFGGTFEGTVLAPNANVTGSTSGQLDGGLIGKSFTGNTEFHDLLFTGTLPAYVVPASGVPEPAPFILCGSALVFAGLIRRRQPKTASGTSR